MPSRHHPSQELRPIHQDLLQALGEFCFLTIPHFLMMDIASERYIRDKLKELQHHRRYSLIGSVRYTKKGGGRRPTMYHLTKYGKTITASIGRQNPARIKSPGHHPQIGKDYEHRFQYLRFVVQLHQRAKEKHLAIERSDHYYEREKGRHRIHQLATKTRIYLDEKGQQRNEPDGVIILQTPQGQKLYLTELHRGHDANRIVQQLETHQEIIREERARKKYGTARNNRVIVICEHEKTQRNMIKKLQGDERMKPYVNYILSKHLEDEKAFSPARFGEQWLNIKGEAVSLY